MARDNKRPRTKREKPEYDQKLLDLARVTRVVKGGRRFRFRATLVIGNRKGKVGVGIGKGGDVSDAIKKAFDDAKKNMVTVAMSKNTIPHDIFMKSGSAKVLLKPAREGRGIVAGGAVRAVVDYAGIKDIVSKSLGTSNKINVARATVKALATFNMPKTRKARAEKTEKEIEEVKK
ncbi:MAG: 30S ribosomal protein S5 [Candidatus Pacebacteria bacterium]|nr:30S ribosomal protein S5 [Candidatus Paceibacterota bacterium]MDR3583588.1 30S ribosomal protein S5 [Candidatus Paceibacterota bacterium]